MTPLMAETRAVVQLAPPVVLAASLRVGAAASLGVGAGFVSVANPSLSPEIPRPELALQPLIAAPIVATSLIEESAVVTNPSGSDNCKSPCLTQNQSLNMDPYNLRSEELALAECCRGVDIRRMWSETEMVRSFGGNLFPGTPDGMFESWDGTLTCVQVVRVPLVPAMNTPEMLESLTHTVLTKVVKSQQWLRATHIVPHEFVIFCWLPVTIPIAVAERTEQLMDRVRDLDPRFSLRLRVPAETGALFPALFAYSNPANKSKTSSRTRSVSESDVTVFNGNEEDSDEDDEPCDWDITWEWDLDLTVAEAGNAKVVDHDETCVEGLVELKTAQVDEHAEQVCLGVETAVLVKASQPGNVQIPPTLERTTTTIFDDGG